MAIDVEDDELEGLTDEEREARKKSIGGPIGAPRQPEETTMIPASGELTPPKQEAIGQPIHMEPANAPRPAYERYQKLSTEQQKPWGDLGVGGKIGRVAETIGGIINPGATSMIPGTQLHHQRQVAGARTAAEEENKEVTSQSEENLREAEAERQRAVGEAALHPPVKPKEEVWKAVPGMIGPGGKVLQEEQNSGQMRWAPEIQGAEPLKPAAEKTPPHITTVQKDGKPHIMERDPESGAYTVDRGIAPSNYAGVILPTKTTHLLGPDGVMHEYQYNPQSGRYDYDMGAAPTGTAQHQIFQASAIEELAPQIIADINANREILGKLSSYYKQWVSGTPVGDPKAAELMTELMSFAAMQPALHAFRSTNALEAFEKIIGGLAKNPDATIATIQGILKTPQAFTNLTKPGGGNNPPKNKPKEEMEWDAKAGKYVPKKKAQ